MLLNVYDTEIVSLLKIQRKILLEILYCLRYIARKRKEIVYPY